MRRCAGIAVRGGLAADSGAVGAGMAATGPGIGPGRDAVARKAAASGRSPNGLRRHGGARVAWPGPVRSARVSQTARTCCARETLRTCPAGRRPRSLPGPDSEHTCGRAPDSEPASRGRTAVRARPGLVFAGRDVSQGTSESDKGRQSFSTGLPGGSCNGARSSCVEPGATRTQAA